MMRSDLDTRICVLRASHTIAPSPRTTCANNQRHSPRGICCAQPTHARMLWPMAHLLRLVAQLVESHLQVVRTAGVPLRWRPRPCAEKNAAPLITALGRRLCERFVGAYAEAEQLRSAVRRRRFFLEERELLRTRDHLLGRAAQLH